MATTTARNERERDILIIFFAEVRQLLLLFPRSSFLLSFLLLFFRGSTKNRRETEYKIRVIRVNEREKRRERR